MADEHNNIQENNDGAKPRGFSSKKHIIFIILVTVLTFGIGSAVIVAGVSNTPENRLSRHMRAAERYLSELNYERAVIEYQRVLEIDPMNVDAILGLADAYIGLGDMEMALETLRDGLERTGDERIRTRLEELAKTDEPSDPSESEDSFSEPEESEPQESESEEREPIFGSMGSVNIGGVDIDIATTNRLLIYNRAREDIGGLDGISDYFDNVVNLSRDLDVDDMEKIRQLSQLQQLYILDAGLSEVSTLVEVVVDLKNLTVLDLGENEISDISPLSGLKNLTTLHLNDNEIRDVSPLSGLKDLTVLDLRWTAVSESDIEWLEKQLPNCDIMW